MAPFIPLQPEASTVVGIVLRRRETYPIIVEKILLNNTARSLSRAPRYYRHGPPVGTTASTSKYLAQWFENPVLLLATRRQVELTSGRHLLARQPRKTHADLAGALYHASPATTLGMS